MPTKSKRVAKPKKPVLTGIELEIAKLEKKYGPRPTVPPLVVVINTKPQGKMRPRTNFKTHTVFKDNADRTYEAIVTEAGKKAIVVAMLSHTGTAQLLMPYFQNPKWPLGFIMECYGWQSTIPYDVDNLQKGVMDGLQKIAYHNDRQICSVGSMNRYKVATEAEQRVVFTVYALDYSEAHNR